MKRTALKRRPKRVDRTDSGYIEWKIPHAGFCTCGCDRWSWHLERHHVVERPTVRRKGGNEWDLRNSMLLHPHCHENHTNAFRRIPLASVPALAIEFAIRLLGEDAALLHLTRMYGHEREAA